MGLYRDENGLVFETDDAFARTHGYEAVSPEDEHRMVQAEAYQQRAEDRGIVGDVNAASTGLASGLTLGGSDVLLGELLTDEDRQTLVSDIGEHPILRGGGEVAGALVGGLASVGSAAARTPAGYLGALASREVESSLTAGGARGVAGAVGIMGYEGAAQSAGQYIGWSSLEDKDVTAEGLSGAIGSGFAFGAVGGGAALGVSKGTIAARRLYARYMDGGGDAAKAAESTWSKAQQEVFEADQHNADIARQRLNDIRTAKTEALRYKQEAKSAVQEERIRAAGAEPRPMESDFEAGVPTNVVPREAQPGGMPTSVFKRPGAVEGPEPLIDVTAPPAGEATSVFKASSTEVIPKKGSAVPEVGSELEAQLAGTKAKLDEGASLKQVGEAAVPGSPVSPQIPPSATPPRQPGRNPSNEIEKMLAEKRLADGAMPDHVQGVPKTDREAAARAARHQDSLRKLPDFGEQLGPKQQRFGKLRNYLGEELDVGPLSGKKPGDIQGPRARLEGPLSELRFDKTKELLGVAAAKEERALLEALEEFQTFQNRLLDEIGRDVLKPAKIEDISHGVPSEIDDGMTPVRERKLAGRDGGPTGAPEVDAFAQGEKTAAASPGRRKNIEALDRAHEEALQRAASAPDPYTRGQALQVADELEQVLGKLAPSDDIVRDINRAHPIFSAYEKASAKLTDAIGDAAHPVSQEFAKGVRDAETNAMKKATDRSMRAVEDAEQFGPEYKSPKERVRYARERKLDADRQYDKLHVDEKQASSEYKAAHGKVREGEKAKRIATKADAKTARATTTAAGKAATVGGVLELLDLPGIPKASDLPVVGPLLGAYLKYKTLKAALGRAGGRIPATADARVAALASRTRDRVARAVDRSLSTVSKVAVKASRTLPQTSGIVAHRIFDDGHPDAKKDATLPEVVGVRMRELQAYVLAPNAIENDVRRELREVSDPDIIAAAEKHRRAMFEYLASTLPKMPQPGLLEKTNWQPNKLQAISFARRMEAASDPAGTLEKLANTREMISLEAAEALQKVYPQLFAQAQQRLMQQAAQSQANIPYSKRVHLSLVYKLPLDAALDPDRLIRTQAVFEKSATPAPISPDQPAAPPMPSVAQPTDISASYMPPADRRSLSR